MAKPLLSDLCTICYTEIPKYRCPRCNTRTCSLECARKHKQRASCSGERDPAAYLKKSQLATPASIDRDYNYLKNVERKIDIAGADVREHGVSVRHHKEGPQARNGRRDDAFRRYLAKNSIAVERAPGGLSRHKNNQSRVTKHEKIFWTIEWRDQNGEQDLRHNASDDSTLSELYYGAQAARRKRKGATETSPEIAGEAGKKRKVSRNASDSPAAALGEDQPSPEHQSCEEGTQSIVRNRNDTASPRLNLEVQEQQHKDYFYLLKPSTTGKSRVLIPLDSHNTITHALNGKVLLEYPTIYVLQNPPDGLPEGFVHVENYRSTFKHTASLAEAVGEGTGANASALGSRKAGGHDEERELAPKAILDMLRRDPRA